MLAANQSKQRLVQQILYHKEISTMFTVATTHHHIQLTHKKTLTLSWVLIRCIYLWKH